MSLKDQVDMELCERAKENILRAYSVPRETSRDILEEAMQITSTDRQEVHGPPERSLGNIASLWSAYLEARGVSSFVVTSEDVAMMLVLLKTARAATKLTQGQEIPRDNLVDIAGYARLADLLSKPKKEGHSASPVSV
jgi:hypothetical protein